MATAEVGAARVSAIVDIVDQLVLSVDPSTFTVADTADAPDSVA